MKSWTWAMPAGLLDPLVRHVRVGDREVVADRRVEQVDVLGDDAQQPADLLDAVVAQVAAADPDLALVVVPEAQEQVDERGLARAARSDDREAAAGRDGQVEAVDGEWLVRAVAETEAADLDARSAGRSGRIGHGRVSLRARSTTAGCASVSSNSRSAAALFVSHSPNAWASGPMTSKLAIATSGSTAR